MVTGLRELRQALRDAEPAERRAITKALKAGAEAVVAAGKREAPRRTGRLANSIRAGASQTRSYIQAGTASRLPYAGPIHFGWRRHGIEANPFLYRAIDQQRDAIVNEFGKALDEALGALFGGG